MFKIPFLPVVSEKVNKDETLKEFSLKDIEFSMSTVTENLRMFRFQIITIEI